MTSRPSPVTSFTAGFSPGSAAGARWRAPMPESLPAAAAVNAL
jgi:hypothetical protein